MKSYSLLSVFVFVFFFAFTSCVSKKKYTALEVQKNEHLAAVAKRDVDLVKLNVLNDSLKKELVKRDSIIDSLNIKLADMGQKKDKDKTKASTYKKPSSLNKGEEYERKSQFVYNFAAYIEWPVIYNGTEFVIGVAGEEDVLKKVRAIIGTKKIGGKTVKIEKYNKVTNYHLVYVTSSNASSFNSIKNDSKKNKTVIITDDEYLFNSGAHISFILDDDKVKYTVNKPSIEKIGLKVSQELMRFSE